MKDKVYDLNTHCHNFAVWTASRSVQRGFTTTKKIADAIEKSGIRDFVQSHSHTDKAEFKTFHTQCAIRIITALKNEKCTYGIAAKIIAIYLKTTLIIPKKGKGCNNIHPPLDRILITNFVKCNNIKGYTYNPWTKLSKGDYWYLISLIEKYESKIDWELERYWKPF